MICSSVCLLRFIVWSSLQGQTPVHPGSAQGGNVTTARAAIWMFFFWRSIGGLLGLTSAAVKLADGTMSRRRLSRFESISAVKR